MARMFRYPELSVNPFRDRICKIFSSSQDGDCTFEDFLDMMSVFSENAPRSVKAEHAFRIYGTISLKWVNIYTSISNSDLELPTQIFLETYLAESKFYLEKANL